MVFARKRQQGPNEQALLAAIDAKLARLAPALKASRPEQAALVSRWLDELLDQRLKVTNS
jgi:hypothetical protein